MSPKDSRDSRVKSLSTGLTRRAFVSAALTSLAACGGGAGGDPQFGTPAPPDAPPGPAPTGSGQPPVGQPPSPPSNEPPLGDPPPPGTAPPPGVPPAPAPEPPGPVPPPPPPSPPPPEAAPEAPPVSIDPRVTLMRLNMAGTVMLKGFHKDSRYERYRRLQVVKEGRTLMPFHGFDFTGGGWPATLRSSRYTLHADGVEIAAFDVPAGAKEGEFDADFSRVSDGWCKLEIRGLGTGETSPPWWVFVKRGSGPVPEQAFTPVVRGTYELTQRGDGWHAFALAPGRYNPTPRPLPRRAYPAFSNLITRAEMNCMQVVPFRFGDQHRPSVNKDGVLSSYDLQAYFWDDMVGKMPRLPSLDGPRGVGSVSMTTHVSIGKAAPDGIPRNTLYVCDPWRVARVTEDGTITTIVGYRHKSLPSYWEDPADVELVGDWSSIPAERRGMHELWGMAWDERTLGVNEAASRIPSEGNERPHATGPVMFLSDTQNDRVLKVEFSATSRSVPPRVTEFVTNSLDAWDIVYSEGLIYVSERKSHRIAAYNATTGAFVRTVVSGRALASVSSFRFVSRTASLATVRAEPCVAPEGLFKLDGDPWLYFGSVAMGQVRRVHLTTGEVQVICDVPLDGNSNYMKIAVSDGTFGPKGTVFTWTWSNAQYGYPYTHLPAGVTYDHWSGRISQWVWFEEYAEVGQWAGFNYATAGTVGQGRLVCGGTNEGLLVISMRQPVDRPGSEAAARGAREFQTRGLNLLHGHNGFGFYGLPLPWGVSTNLDAYFTLHGHTRT